jgi:polyvinyl alcohol dehydrogenase (cytochrome)
MRWRHGFIAAVVLLTACSSSGGAKSHAPTTSTAGPSVADWTLYGHDLANSRLNPLETTITRANVGRLTRGWSTSGLVGVTGTPTVSSGVVYYDDWTGTVHAVKAATGKPIWTNKVGGVFIASPAVTDDAVYVAAGATLTRLDRATGKTRWNATTNDSPFAGIDASPVPVDGLVIQATASNEEPIPKQTYTFRGSISAFDAQTGKEKWRFYTTKNNAHDGPGVGLWSTPAVDTKRKLLYVGSGNAYAEPTGPLADSVLAINYETGKLAWSRQFRKNDVFAAGNPKSKDTDVGASPNMWTVNGRDFVGVGDKAGVYHALDRDTGAIVWTASLSEGAVFGGEVGSGAYVDGKIIVSSNNGGPALSAPGSVATVYALDPATGKILWRAKPLAQKIFGPVSAIPGVAFVGTTTGLYVALDTNTGKQLWSFKAPNQVGGGAAIVNGRVFWGYGFTLFSGGGDGGLLTFTVPPASSTTTAVRCARPFKPGVTTQTIDGRPALLTVPAKYDGHTPIPVVFALHPLSVSYTAAPFIAGLDTMAPRYTFISVAPSGRLNGPTPFWNATDIAGNEDVRFLSHVLDWLEGHLCVDTTRVYSLGMSNGAQMSSVLACQLSNRITAVAPVAGAEFYSSCRGRPVPVIAFHGTKDPFVGFKGGGLDAATIADENLWKAHKPAHVPVHHGVEAAMQTWAVHNGCDPQPVTVRISHEVRRRTWQHCKAATILYIIDGGGHTWPGRPVPGSEASFGHTTMDISATPLIFRFLFAQRS